MSYHFRNLIFEGGGVKGIAYIGALEVIENKAILPDIKRVGGTSAGSIIALLLCLNYSLDEIRQILKELDFKKFLDDSWGIIKDTRRLITRYGWYKGDYFRDWIGSVIKAKTGNSEATFRDVYSQKGPKQFRDLYVIGTNLSTHFEEVFSFEHTPRMVIADAVRISMSIPLFFVAKKARNGDVYVDGGVLDNYPIKLFDQEKYVERFSHLTDYYARHNSRLAEEKQGYSPYVYNKETLGFRLDSAKDITIFNGEHQPDRQKITDFLSFTWNLIGTLMDLQDNQHLHSDDWHRTVYIDNIGVKSTDFMINDQNKEELVASGKRGTERYFTWFDGQDCCAYNKP